jgi:hypothetical protein
VLFPVHSSDSQPTRILRGHLDRVTSIVYRRSQQQLISAARDGMVFVWEAPKAKPERSKENKSRRNELYYGTAAGRYDFANVAQRVLGSAGVSNAAEEGAGEDGEGASVARRVLPLQESTGSIAGQAAGLRRTSAVGTVQHTLRQADDNSGDSSGDNWSEDEVLPTLVSNHRGRGGGSSGAASSGDTGRRGSKAARTIASASAGAGGAPSISSAGARATASAPATDSRNVRSVAAGTAIADRSTSSTINSSSRFVPPIIQQYLREAGRSAPVVTDLTGSGTEGPAVTQRTAHSNSNSGVQTTHNNNSSEPGRSWDTVEGIFEAPTSNSSSVGLGGFLPPSNVFGDYSGVGSGIIRTGNVGSIIGSVSSGAEPPVSGSALGRADSVSGVAGGTRAAPALPLQPNERYKAWLKQARGKNNTKKK